MPEYLSPGVYIEEVAARIKAIEGVSKSTAGFAGECERGPVPGYDPFVPNVIAGQVFELPPNTEGHEHNERESQQEEVNVVIKGSGIWRIDGEEVEVREGTFLRFDPETTRVPIAGPEGMTMIAVGARRGSYEPRGPF